MARKHCFCLILCLLSSLLAFPQQMVSGKVLDANTGRPLPDISVYLDNTSIGTATNARGEFSIGHIPAAKYKLVVSGISYKTFSTIIDTRDTISYMTVELTREADVLKRTVVKAPDPNGWAKWGQLFINLFIGTSPKAKDCRILNHEVLKFTLIDENTLRVYAEKPIQLHNAALGYDISYDLDDLTYDFFSGVVGYTGHIFFKDLALARSNGKTITWQQNRFEAYKGSLMHFMRSFYRNKLQPEGFQMLSLPGNAPIAIDSVGFAADSTLAGFYSSDSLQISYTVKAAPAAYKRLSPATRHDPYPISQLVFINKKPVYVLSNGFFYSGSDLKMTGYWGWSETIGTLLPYDYDPPL